MKREVDTTLVKVKSAYFYGIDAFDVDVEVNFLDRSMPGFEIIGLAGREVTESRERVKNAVINSFKEFPHGKKIVVNLAPADIPKEGSYYDLPIAASVISYMKDFRFPEDSAFFGEVSLDGSVRKTKGVFLFVTFAKERGLNNVFIPSSCYNEVTSIKDVNIYPISNLRDLVDYSSICSDDCIRRQPVPISCTEDNRVDVDFSDVVGQDMAKRALEISACGGHNILMTGSPGSGKSMLARALCGILPDLRPQEELEVAKIYSACGLFDPNIFTNRYRPYRSPHHTVSYSGMVGGGAVPHPGEVSLAHKGVLFLDEFSEFQIPIIECLRQPMESGCITISRSRGSIKLPCDFTLVACSNPCPCGYLGDRKVRCTCKPPQVDRYRRKVSGPILDRIDLFVRVWNPDFDKIIGSKALLTSQERSSTKIKERVESVRCIQERRFIREGITVNARMTNNMVKEYCALSPPCEDLLSQAMQKFNLSPRSLFKIIKVARTIADMDGAPAITATHLAESIQYKNI